MPVRSNGSSMPMALERLVVGEILDQQYDFAQVAGKRLRKRIQRTARDRLHLVGRGRISEAPHRQAA